MTESSRPPLVAIRQTGGIAGLVLIASASWWVLAAGATTMGNPEAGLPGRLMQAMMRPAEAGTYLGAAAVMWVVMMVAMMAPAALFMMAMLGRMKRSSAFGTDSALFASGYLVGWSAFAALAAGLQWWLHARGWLSGMSLSTSTGVAAGLLAAAGLYQFTPIKDACLARCQSPMAFFLEHWRDGRLGAVQMGLRHSLYCVGCCWVLMLLMFAGGAMSVLTMAALCAFILAERVFPAGRWASRVPGALLLLWAGWLLWSLPGSGDPPA